MREALACRGEQLGAGFTCFFGAAGFDAEHLEHDGGLGFLSRAVASGRRGGRSRA